MNFSYDKLKKYLRTLGDVASEGESEALGDKVPLLVSSCYSACRARIFGSERLVLLCQHERGLSPEQVQLHAALISAHYSLPLLFVFQLGTREFCAALIVANIPFVIVGRQIFVPGAAMAITEAKFNKGTPAPIRRFTPLGQVILLYHLQRREHGDQLSFQQLLSDLKIHKVYVSRSARDLEHAGLAQIMSTGRHRQLVFPYDRRKTWEMAQPFLISPVKRSVRLEQLPPGLPLAGPSALAALTNLNDDPVTTYAGYALALAPGAVRQYSGSRVELWRYNPTLLCEQSGVVDKLSLFLSLKDNQDPRIQSGLAAMMEALPW